MVNICSLLMLRGIMVRCEKQIFSALGTALIIASYNAISQDIRNGTQSVVENVRGDRA